MASGDSMGITIKDIPTEVLAYIISLTEGLPTWKALREVNTTLASLATPLVFAEVEVWIQTESLLRSVILLSTEWMLLDERRTVSTGFGGYGTWTLLISEQIAFYRE